MTDPLIAEAKKRIAADHAREAIIDRAQRFAEVLAFDEDPARRQVAAELIEIVGVPS